MVSDTNNLYYSRAEVQEYAIKEVCANPNVDIVVEVIGGTGVAKLFVESAKKQNLPIAECFK